MKAKSMIDTNDTTSKVDDDENELDKLKNLEIPSVHRKMMNMLMRYEFAVRCHSKIEIKHERFLKIHNDKTKSKVGFSSSIAFYLYELLASNISRDH